MRSIQVSTEVFAGIWKSQQSGEQSEDAILCRLLGLATDEPAPAPERPTSIGFVDNRFGVVFPPGFEISRVYRGHEYRAQAVGGMWIRADDQTGYMSLNQLSDSIGANENAWDSWFFVNEAGERKPIATLRDPSKVRRRPRRNQVIGGTFEELGL